MVLDIFVVTHSVFSHFFHAKGNRNGRRKLPWLHSGSWLFQVAIFFFLWVLGMEREEKFYFIHFMIFYFKKRWKEREKNSYICLKIIILKRNK